MNQTDAVTDQIRDWYENSPTAKRAYARFRADIDTVMAQAKPKVQEFWEQVGPLIDPPAKDEAKHSDGPRSTTGSQNS
jgi:hypothetical protein